MESCFNTSGPTEYLASIGGWQRPVVEHLRAGIIAADLFAEEIKWGHLVYFASGPAVLIRAEEARVLFGFWRGKRLVDDEPRLKPSGKYEMATLIIDPGLDFKSIDVAGLVRRAFDLNNEFGDPRLDAKRKP
ncbi:MAG: DUF1801 domain-containing protein [Pyrinomonadaceae bacterium]